MNAPQGQTVVHLPLPAGFRRADILAFHGRDSSAQSEQVTPDSLRKGMLWDGTAACLHLRFTPDAIEARLCRDDAAIAPQAVEALARRMLGLDQDIESFEARYHAHPHLGKLIAAQSGLRLPVTASPFEALTWAITGQQISVSAAISIRRRLIAATGRRHSDGLLCPPSPQDILDLGEDRLRQAGYSQAKARTLLAVSHHVISGQLDLDVPSHGPTILNLAERMLAIPGIGPWTVSYTLLRGHGWLDGSLHGDVAVRRGLQNLLGRSDTVTPRWAEQWLAPFSPWRALVAAHLWAAQSAASY